MQTQEVPTQELTKWADALYAIGKSIPDDELAHDLIALAKNMYSTRNTLSEYYMVVPIDTLQKWKREIQRLSVSDRFATKEMPNEILRVAQSIQRYLSEIVRFGSSGFVRDSQPALELTWKSILLCFTLWYGGQSFSLSDKELNTELGLGKNTQIKHALEELTAKSVFLEKGSGLIILDPSYKMDVDNAALFLIAMGANLTPHTNLRRGYSTIQTGFLEFSRSHHHPMVSLAENVRSYVSDYCQRVFARLFGMLRENGVQPDYSVLRRFLTRLSLYSSLDFVVSNEEQIRILVEKLEELKTAILVPVLSGEKFVLLRKEVMKD